MKSDRQYNITKSELRALYRIKRKELSDKSRLDEKVIHNFLNSSLYKDADLILCYVSLPGEIDTDYLIEKALSDGKKVGVPYCEDRNGAMSFYYIHSLDELCPGSYGIREPYPEKAKPVTSFDNAILVVPGLTFDLSGKRLGYGKGYYDRFLQIHSLYSVGLCYNSFIADYIPTDKYDKSVLNIVTDSRIIVCGNGGKNG